MLINNYKNHVPFGELGLIVMDNCKELGERIDQHLVSIRKKHDETCPDSFLIRKTETRFANGEGKVLIEETVRGKDIYILTDVGNYSMTYSLYGRENLKSPDDHIQDVKRILSAMAGKARRITVLMPLLYASRQHGRKRRESLDCAMMLQELERLGVNDILTFDAHDPTIQNAIPLISFENIYPTFEIVRTFLETEPLIAKNTDEMLIISPDTGAMDRAVYYSSVLGYDIGLFYKRRDHSKVVRGKNPIVQHEYIGQDVKGRNILIVDDMIASGESVLEIAKELKERQAGKVFMATSFALFTEGIQRFRRFHEEGVLDMLFTTNLSYIPKEAQEEPWIKVVDLSFFMSRMLNRLNFDVSISDMIDAAKGIEDLRRLTERL